jgi:cell division inhibitor SepF
MAIGDTWRRALEYFGLVDGDYIDEGEYTDEHDFQTGGHREQRGGGGPDTMGDEPIREPQRERSSVGVGRRRAREDDMDDIFGDDDPPPRRRRGGTNPDMAPVGNGGGGGGGGRGSTGENVQMKLVSPRSFNDAQKVADEFKAGRPVILNLQDTDADLARRLIDFGSGLTYALSGGMQKVADQTFLLTPQNVSVSAAEAERMLEGGFYNQS